MKDHKIAALFLFPALLLFTLSCSKSTIKGEITSVVEGDGGEGTIVMIDKGSNAGIKLNQEGWVMEKGDTFATVRVDELESDTCRAVVLEHTPFKAVTEGLAVRFDVNGTILSPETPAPPKPCSDILGPYVPTVGGNMTRTGSYDEKGVPSPIGILCIFKASSGITTFTPPVADGLAFFSDDSNFWYAIDLNGGKRADNSGVTSMTSFESPTVLDGTIYIPGENYFHAITEQTETRKWRLQVEANSPAVADGVVFLSSIYGVFSALDAQTGREIWSIDSGNPTRVSPAVDGDTVYFGGGENYLYAVDAKTGAVKWKYGVESYFTCRYVVVSGDAIYVATRKNLIALDKQTHIEKWRFQIDGFLGTAPAVACGVVYIFNQGSLYALDAKTGLEKWRFNFREMGVEENGTAYDPPIVVDGIVYFGGLDESVYAVDAETGKLVWSYKTEHKTSTPVVVGGVLYVTSGPYLYAIK